jgi:serine/threonine-protein kinase
VERPSEVREGSLVLEHYLVERVIGKMGSCALAKVRHTRVGKRFFLKHLSAEASSSPHAVERFLQTARAAMRLRSEHAARIVDAGRLSSGVPYVVTESFPGSELREILRLRGALACEEAVDIVLQAAHAVAEAHRHGITHGSLCPSTLFVTSSADGSPTVKVLEFGSSHTLRTDPFAVRLRSWTQGTAIFGESMRLWDTLAYSAPEQLRGSAGATPRSDVWALGAILFELLYGLPPFHGQSSVALMAAIVADRPVLPPHSARRVPRDLASLALRCLSKAPEARFQSVAELAAGLRDFASIDARLIADRIQRIERYDPDRAPWSCSNQALISISPESGDRARHTSQRGVARWAVPLALAVTGALGGVLAGTFVARAIASSAEGSAPFVLFWSGSTP